ncbi:hypothetical protein DPMN_121332 [Dreissena polymorpha]|uniref:Uncharacterized protein n=1 Tax=Dreissena polymorpha TaxID=45954 RepID=A0A9D4GMI9_DREPO|nr:hypothetical protein DPMN_121332 [Dreissena polymorpha]
MKASLCIGQNQSISQEIFTMCDKSLTSNVTSSRLISRYGRFKEAEAILEQVDGLISNKVMPNSPFKKSKISQSCWTGEKNSQPFCKT